MLSSSCIMSLGAESPRPRACPQLPTAARVLYTCGRAVSIGVEHIGCAGCPRNLQRVVPGGGGLRLPKPPAWLSLESVCVCRVHGIRRFRFVGEYHCIFVFSAPRGARAGHAAGRVSGLAGGGPETRESPGPRDRESRDRGARTQCVETSGQGFSGEAALSSNEPIPTEAS